MSIGTHLSVAGGPVPALVPGQCAAGPSGGPAGGAVPGNGGGFSVPRGEAARLQLLPGGCAGASSGAGCRLRLAPGVRGAPVRELGGRERERSSRNPGDAGCTRRCAAFALGEARPGAASSPRLELPGAPGALGLPLREPLPGPAPVLRHSRDALLRPQPARSFGLRRGQHHVSVGLECLPCFLVTGTLVQRQIRNLGDFVCSWILLVHLHPCWCL